MSDPSPVRLVVLISGNGTNLQAILDACASGALPAQVVAVISNRPGAPGLVRAQNSAVPTDVLEKSRGEKRAQYDQRLTELVSSFRPDWVVLAGWMRILTASFLNQFPDRVINLHPALPGAFPGTDAIQRAYAASRRGEINATGVMVHLVPDEDVDAGPVLAQETVAILPEDTLESLAARIHLVEHRVLVTTLRQVIAVPSR
jgi:phosphoribosylglycinamide formyltransferase-1